MSQQKIILIFGQIKINKNLQKISYMRKTLILLMSISTVGFAQLGLNWQEVGPDDAGGRTRAVLFDKTDATGNTLYAGSAGGGVFKSTNGGSTWLPINDQSKVFNISAMTQAPNGVIYIGTGESFVRDGRANRTTGFIGTGLYKLVGGTISLVKDSSTFGNINELATDPSNSQIIYVASNKGFFISTDGGATFNLETTSTTFAQDVKVGSDGTVFYVSGNFKSNSIKIYKSANGVIGSFSDITPTNAVENPLVTKFGRVELAISPSNPNYVYFCASTYTSSTIEQRLNAVYGSNDKGTTWKAITLGSSLIMEPFESFYGTDASSTLIYNYYGDYSNTIKVDPASPTHIFVGGYVLYQWTQLPSAPFGNGAWVQVGQNAAQNNQFYLHSFTHDVSFKPNDPTVMFVATDGGVFKRFFSTITGGGQIENILAANRGLNVSNMNNVAYLNYPHNASTTSTMSPVGGVVGSALSDGPIYIPGNLNTALSSNNFVLSDAFSIDVSRINGNTSFSSFLYGQIRRNTNIKLNPFAAFTEDYYRSMLGTSTKPTLPAFSGTLTPMELWENWGQLPAVDSSVLWNKVDSVYIKLIASSSQKTFTLSYSRPQKNAKYDIVEVRSAPAMSLIPSPSVSYSILPTYSSGSITAYSFLGSGYDNSLPANHKIILNDQTLLDNIIVTFATPPLSPPNKDSIIMLKLKLTYNTGDYVYTKNTDLGLPNTVNIMDSIQLTAPLSYTLSPYTKNSVKIPTAQSARLAVGLKGCVIVCKRALNGDIMPTWVKIAGSKSRIDSAGVPTKTTVAVKGDVQVLKWAPSGTELYFSTYDATSSSYYLYRTSHIGFIGDYDYRDYGGIFNTDIDSTYGVNSASGMSVTRSGNKTDIKFRTTAIGKFPYPINGIFVSDNNQSVIIALGGYSNSKKIMMSVGDARTLMRNETDDTNFSDKSSNLPNIPAYSCLMLSGDNNKVLLGTENGIYSTSDITQAAPVWASENNSQLPAVPVFAIRQQTMPHWLCYNSGYVYVATHGRGIWSTSKYATPYVVSVNEISSDKIVDNKFLHIYPNPANDLTSIQYELPTGIHNVMLTITDLTGKLISSENIRVNSTGTAIDMQLNTSNLISGIYIIQVKTDSFVKSGKLIISK